MARILQDVGFVHLHVHSSYSLLEGAMKIGKLAELAAADKQPALALTDTNNLFGALEFSEKLAGAGHPADRRASSSRSASRSRTRSRASCRADQCRAAGADARRATATSCGS